MNAAAIAAEKYAVDADTGTAMPRAEPGFFGSADRPRFGWLHRPVSTESGIGMVIVPPFGYEAVCAHRSLRHLAEDAARAGLIAVRFDLDGTGDSAGDDLEPDRVEAWIASIDDACDLARQAGAKRIVLVGIRLGALLATLAAARRDDIAGLVAIAAPPSGKAFVRESRALQMALGLPPPPDPPGQQDDVQEGVGFALTAETRSALAQINLTESARRPAPAVLLLDRDDLAGNDAWAAHLRMLGVEVEQRRLSGYVEMVLNPHNAEVPQAIIDAAIAFASTRPRLAFPAPSRPPVEFAARARIATNEDKVTEELVAIDNCLCGILTRPCNDESGRTVLLLNAGATPRLGPNRLYVAFARRLAARGDTVLRFDQSGIGDSRTRRDGVENTVYSDQAIGDVGAAVAWVRDLGAREIVLVGLCSGAYHALKAAEAGQAIDTVVAINPLTFAYKEGMPLDFAAFRAAAEVARYNRSLRSAASWRKLLRGEVAMGNAIRVFIQRARSISDRHAKNLLHRLGIRLPGDLGSELLALARRGVALRFVFADDDPGYRMLIERGGLAVPKLLTSSALRIRTINGPDHTFTARWSHPILFDAIIEAMKR